MKKVSQFIGKCSLVILTALALAGCHSGPSSADIWSTPESSGMFASDSLGGNTSTSIVGGGTVTTKVAIKPEDTLRITFIGPEGVVIAPFEGRVSEEGNITLNLIGSMKAAGKTLAELQKDIHDAYVPLYFVRLNVQVVGQDRYYFVGGEVRIPNRYPLIGEITLTKAIQTAGDFTDWSKKTRVRITRADGSSIGNIDCTKILEGKTADIPIRADDKIYVPRRGSFGQ